MSSEERLEKLICVVGFSVQSVFDFCFLLAVVFCNSFQACYSLPSTTDLI